MKNTLTRSKWCALDFFLLDFSCWCNPIDVVCNEEKNISWNSRIKRNYKIVNFHSLTKELTREALFNLYLSLSFTSSSVFCRLALLLFLGKQTEFHWRKITISFGFPLLFDVDEVLLNRKTFPKLSPWNAVHRAIDVWLFHFLILSIRTPNEPKNEVKIRLTKTCGHLWKSIFSLVVRFVGEIEERQKSMEIFSAPKILWPISETRHKTNHFCVEGPNPQLQWIFSWRFSFPDKFEIVICKWVHSSVELIVFALRLTHSIGSLNVYEWTDKRDNFHLFKGRHKRKIN